MGATGFYTLGIFSGTVYFVPIAVVFMSIFYPAKTTFTYLLLYFILFSVVAYLFISGQSVLFIKADDLLTDHFHWMVYGLCQGLFFMISSLTIYNYRKSVKLMQDKMTIERDEFEQVRSKLEKRNLDLTYENQVPREALDEVNALSGLQTICANCKKILDDNGEWHQIEDYIEKHSKTKFSHTTCEDCAKELYQHTLWYRTRYCDCQ